MTTVAGARADILGAMDLTLVVNCLLIVVARMADVSLGTLRTVSVIYGRRGLASALGFVEVLIWIFVVSHVIGLAQEKPIYAVFYALGFATGNFIGITIEQFFAMGEQAVRIFTRQGHLMADTLRDEGFGVTEFDGRGRDGPVGLLFIEAPRKRVAELVNRAREIDPSCYYVIDDVRHASSARLRSQSPSWWGSVAVR